MSNIRDKKRPLNAVRIKLTDKSPSSLSGVAGALLGGDHNYTSSSANHPDEDVSTKDFPPLPLSPKSPAPKKAMQSKSAPEHVDMDDSPLESERVDIVASLSELINARADNTDLQIVNLKKTIDFVFEELKDVKEKMCNLEVKVTKDEARIDACQQRITDLERYSRRWNLRLFGVKETEKEDARKKVIELCQKLLPEYKDRILHTVDTVHRIGPKRLNSDRPRALIIRFSSRICRDDIWRAAKISSFLKDNNLKFAEDLSKEDRERRSQLWPLIEKARKEGKPAFYVGCRGFVNGSEIFPTSR